ncbi:MAG: quinolinate synthase NadA [Methanomassiliicoccales archaeon]|nr:MAG: quinolinate synthase NadA [Methanomassiliicoccales archaeon]
MDMEELAEQIIRLKEEQDAILLVHNYQRPEIQDVADFLGDSLGLAMKASKVDKKNIIFCGVDFMAESAKILNPDKRVVHPIVPPHLIAKCPMAAMADRETVLAYKAKHPGAVVVSYVNTTAEVKAVSDYCCTSSNAVKVVSNIPEKKVIFVPDEHLGNYVKRSIKDKEIILWPGYCRTHVRITKQEVLELKDEHPEAVIIVHPECTYDVIDIADEVFSTEGMTKYAASSDATEFIVGTERELGHRLRKENPGKKFYFGQRAVCPNMKQIRIENVLNSMRTLRPTVELDPEIMKLARIPLERMLEMGRGD